MMSDYSNPELEALTGAERFEYFVDNGVAFNLYVYEVEAQYMDEYAAVCIAADRLDLVNEIEPV